MTHDEFEKGYKLLLRFFKEIGRFNDFKTITAKNNPSYKTYLKKQFDDKKMGWNKFFSYTWFVGENYEQYNDPSLNELRNGWFEFVADNKPDLFMV